MKLHEYQAKEISAAYGIPVQKGTVVDRPEKIDEVALPYPVVLKAQVLVGGRGKAGGIKLAATPDEARTKAAQILGMDIKGEKVRRLLVVEAANIATEYYLAFTIDRAARRLVVIASAAGGIDIEEVARTTPEKIVKRHVDPFMRFHPYQAREIGRALAFEGRQLVEFATIAHNLSRVCIEMDAELAEINPLAVADGKLLAIDAKLIIDDNATYRHDGLPRNEELTELETAAKAEGLSYVELDGDVAIIGNGAGLVTVDLRNKQVTAPDGRSFDFPIAENYRQMLLEGLDHIDATLRFEGEIDAYERRDRERRPWVYERSHQSTGEEKTRP